MHALNLETLWGSLRDAALCGGQALSELSPGHGAAYWRDHAYVPLSQMTPALDAAAERTMSLAEIESRQRVSDGLIRDERNDVARFFRLEPPSRSGPRGPLGDLGDVGREDADAYLGAGPVSVRLESGSTMMRARAYRSPVAAAAEARVSERASCAAIAAQVEHEALGSPIAQDAARRIRLAILALR